MNYLLVSRAMFGLGIVIYLGGVFFAFAAAGWKSRFSPRVVDIAVIGSGAMLFAAATYFSRLHQEREREKEKAFIDELKAKADDLTMEDPEDCLEDLCFLYEEHERRQILERLVQMPKGQRKLQIVLTQMEDGAE